MSNLDREKLYHEFISGKSIQDLSEEHGVTWSKMYKEISGRFPCKDTLLESEKCEIVSLYLSGMSMPKIAEKFKVSHKLIGKILNSVGIKSVNNGKRKWNLNEHYFDEIDTSNKAYILGLLYADGYNGKNKGTIRIQLQCEDVDILKKINKEVESDKPLKLIKCSDKVASNGFISKDMYQLEIYSSHMCSVLNKIGMTQGKSLTLSFPKLNNKDLIRSFILGYFDGDGSFCYSNKNAAHHYQSIVTITSTDRFCKECLDFLRNELHIGGSIFDASCHNGVTKVLTIGGNTQCKIFLDWLYSDADMYIMRKHDRYISAYYPKIA